MNKQNEPAFPVDVMFKEDGCISGVQTSNFSGFESGLTKREYFAAKAMQGILSDPKRCTWENRGDTVEIAVKIADLMMEALGEK